MRTGFKQAASALRAKGLRPARATNCPLMQSRGYPWGFAAVPLRKGLTDATVTPEDACFGADTLSGLVDALAHYKAEQGEKVQEASANAETSEQQAEQTASARVDTQALADAGLSSDKLAALQVLLSGSSLNREQVRELVQEVAGEALASVALKAKENQEAAEARIGEAIDEALKRAAGMLPVVHEIKVVDRGTFRVEGCHPSFPTLLREMSLGLNVWIHGPAGSGKTTGVLKAAEKLERNVHLLTNIRDEFQVLGFMNAAGDYVPTAVYRWATDPGSILLIDEIDRSDETALCALHAIIENGVGAFACGQVKIPAENMVVCTANTYGTGPDAEYVGAARLDAATRNRFPTRLAWDYDEGLETRIVVAAGGDAADAAYGQRIRRELSQRKIRLVWSPRDTVALAKRVASGCTRSEAVSLSALAEVDEHTRGEILKAVA